ncbi:MAG: hydrogenase formation protein HypD [bacterium]|nr:hydrogenase formation protein HypD [bacterium]
MKFIDEFANKEVATGIINQINKIATKKCTLMEVCGTHTMALFRFGIRDILSNNINVVAGPGCPVCVIPQEMIDKVIELASSAVIATYGDMFRVPGSRSSLEKERAKGSDVRIIYSAQDALQIAMQNPDKEVVFFAIGFETTTPATAYTLIQAKEKQIDNFFILCGHKLIPPAMETLCQGNLNIHGFICPGHVSTIIGSAPYQEIANRYKVPCVITGFEPLDILEGIYALIRQINTDRADVENAYKRAVRFYGNTLAKEVIDNVFKVVDSNWRGLGVIPGSGLAVRDEFIEFDAEQKFNIHLRQIEPVKPQPGCLCGDILRGVITPPECTNFGTLCTPEEPLGPCMVSSEGTCAAYYKYGKKGNSKIK